MGQLRNGVHRGQLHLFVDRRRADVQRAAEDEREAEHVVHLVRVVGTPGADNGVFTHRFRQRRQNFRLRVRQGQDHRRARHLLHHLLGQHFRTRAAEEDIRAVNHVLKRALAVVFYRIRRFGFRHVRLAIFVNHALGVADHNVVFLHTQRHQQVHTGNRRRASAGDHHAHVGEIFLYHAQAVENGGGADNGRSVLVVMEHGNVHTLAQLLLDIETFRRFDVFQVDPAEGRLQRGHHVDEFVRIELVHLDIKHVDTGEFLEQHPLAFHHRLTGQRADITEPQYRRAVRDHGNKVAARGVFIGRQRIFFDFQTRGRHARRVGQRQIALCRQRLGWGDLNFARDRELVKIEGTLFQLLIHLIFPFTYRSKG